MKRLSDKVIDAFNFRIKAEFESSYLYEAMACNLDFKGFKYAAKLWREDAKGERLHAKWAIDYMLGMDIQPIIPTIVAPKEQNYAGIKEIVDATVVHEDMVTSQCKDLAKLALTSEDTLTFSFVSDHYLKEQIEETSKVLERQKYVQLFLEAKDFAGLEKYFKHQLK